MGHLAASGRLAKAVPDDIFEPYELRSRAGRAEPGFLVVSPGYAGAEPWGVSFIRNADPHICALEAVGVPTLPILRAVYGAVRADRVWRRRCEAHKEQYEVIEAARQAVRKARLSFLSLPGWLQLDPT